MATQRRSLRRQTASSVAPSSPAASSVASPVRARRGAKKRGVIESDEEEDEEEKLVAEAEEEDADSLIGGDDDEEEEEEEEEEKPVKTNGKRPSRPSETDSLMHDSDDKENALNAEEEDEEEDDIDDLLESSKASPPPPLSQPTVPPIPSVNKFIPKPPRTPFRPAVPAASIPDPPKGPQKRLIIEKMVLENFKSYAGRQVIGPFHKSFSAIVGPNGSGKSNTIDALLFVFGFKAKQMRQGKLSELIHNSEDWPDLEYCSVEVWFKEIIDLPGPDAFEVVPNSSLIVARTAYKDNKSKYTINNKTSSYTEATTLLKDRGIDLTHKRFLILQGEVESIAQMKPKAANEHEEGLLEYLEDIIGTSKYKTAIEEALVQVDALNEVMGEKKGRLGIVVRELNALKGRKKEAEDYLRDQNELARRQSALYQYYLFQLNSNLALVEQNLTRFKKELDEEIQANQGNLAEIEELQANFDEQNAVYLEVKSNTEKIMKELAIQEKKEVQLQEKKKHVQSQQKKLKKSLTEDSHSKSSALSWVENHEETIEKTRKELEKLESRLATEEQEFEEIRDSLKDKTADFSNQIEVHQQELEPWTAKISEKQALIDVAESERNLLEQRASGAVEAVTEAEEQLEALVNAGREKEETLANLEQEKITLKKRLATAEKSLAALTSKESTVRQYASGLRDRVEEAKASLAAGKGEDAMLSGLKKLKEMGRLDGFHGRLGDLGVIDDKYDVAVTTACGGSLNALVTDTIEQGQAVIEHLRRTGGRASIFVLNKLPNKDLGPRDTPEGVPRLFDLIKPKDARLATAFFKAVGQTLVAKDLDQANRIAYGKQRWRVVTLGGELIDTSGAMSGGGTRVQRGGMSSKFASDCVEPQVITRFEKESDVAQQDLAAFLSEKKAAEHEVTDNKQRIPQVELSITKIELDVKNGRKRVAEADKRLQELQSQNKPNAEDERRIKLLEKEVATHTKEVQSLRQKSAGIEDAIKQLQDKILEVGGIKLRAQKSKVDGIKQQIDLSSDKVTKAEVEQAKSAKDAEKLEKAIQSNTSKLQDLDAQLEEHDQHLNACLEDMRLVQAAVDEARFGLESLEEELAAVKEELDEKSGSLNVFKARELDLKQKIDDNTKTLKDSRNRHSHWTDRHAELELQYVDEDDEDEAPKPKESSPTLEDMDVDGEAAPAAEGETPAESEPKPEKPRSTNQELEIFSKDELEALDVNILKADVANLEERVLKSKPNMSVLQEFRRRQAEFDERQADLNKVTAERDSGKTRYDDLRQTRHFEFMAGFNAISSKLKEMYQLITLGGLAELELVDSLDPFSEGIIFSVMPPKKSWKNISNLSGGEKTLSSLALVFALHVYKPTPLYFMDEIDAALDFRNVSIIANYIRERTKSAQFIIISLRSDMFELSHRLVGIYKTSNATKSVAIDNGQLIPAK